MQPVMTAHVLVRSARTASRVRKTAIALRGGMRGMLQEAVADGLGDLGDHAREPVPIEGFLDRCGSLVRLAGALQRGRRVRRRRGRAEAWRTSVARPVIGRSMAARQLPVGRRRGPRAGSPLLMISLGEPFTLVVRVALGSGGRSEAPRLYPDVADASPKMRNAVAQHQS